jgi:hypothetical protein
MIVLLACCLAFGAAEPTSRPTRDDGNWCTLSDDDVALGPHHTRHADVFGKYVDGYNLAVLRGIDLVQQSAPDGGGYFANPTATPAESPIGYELKLFGHPLLDPPRPTSYCSGSSYAAFIEAYEHHPRSGRHREDFPRAARSDALAGAGRRPARGRREVLGPLERRRLRLGIRARSIQRHGIEVKPIKLGPGDFMNISWKSGAGHSVVFLGWHKDASGNKSVMYWASQKGTNGLGDQLASLDRIKEVKIVRLVAPEKLFTFDPATIVNRKVAGDRIGGE